MEPSPAAPDLSFIPDEFRTDGQPDLDRYKAHVEDLIAHKARTDEARAQAPETAEGYEFKVPDGLTYEFEGLPEGYAVELKTDDPAMQPLFQEFGGWLHKYGLPAGAAQEAMALLAKYTAAQDAQGWSEFNADMKTLGPNKDARIGALKRLMEARLPADQVEALAGSVRTAKGVQALEKLLALPGGGAPTSQKAPAIPDDATPYDRLKAANAKTR